MIEETSLHLQCTYCGTGKFYEPNMVHKREEDIDMVDKFQQYGVDCLICEKFIPIISGK